MLLALVPKPRVNLTRFHDVFAPNSKHRAQVTPAKRGKVKKVRPPDQDQTTARILPFLCSGVSPEARILLKLGAAAALILLLLLFSSTEVDFVYKGF